MVAIADALAMSLALLAVPDLLPPPQRPEWGKGAFAFPTQVTISVPEGWKDPIERYLWVLDETLAAKGQYELVMRADPDAGVIRIYRPIGAEMMPGSYTLEVNARGIRIGLLEPTDAFNALATLAQLIEQSEGEPVAIPACHIHDWPELPIRAVHIDLTCQQYTAEYVQELMRTLARYKVNAILMEYSAMFPFHKHAAIRRPDAFSEEDVRAIRQTAAACNQELIPFLQCLGHLEYVLHREEYARYGSTHNRYMYCPSSDATMPLVRELIDEILDQHPGLRYLHVGGDEVSADKCERCVVYAKEHGFSELYVRHYRAVADYCRERGVVPLMWSDMVLQHPEALPDLPRNVSWVVWDYGTTTDPAPSVWHGASLDKLDGLKPTYREYFGDGIGLADARDRGGFVAFGHAPGFRKLGFDAFTAPAARCSGDNFDLPRFELHMANIRLAFLKAAVFKLPGAILTSWSYRGSPHEVCLPEYVCASYGWNTAAPDIEDLLATFFRQRYGIEGTKLAEAVLAESHIVPPSTLARPTLDDDERAWRVTAATQLEQIRRLARTEPATALAGLRTQLDQIAQSKHLWQEAMRTGKRNQRELRCWDLSRRHLEHRLQLVPPLWHLIRVADGETAADKQQVERWQQQLESLSESRARLRSEWAELYRDICTPRHLETELDHRFDAEAVIIRDVLSGG